MKKLNKKLFSIILTVLLISLSFAGCSNGSKTESGNQETEESQTDSDIKTVLDMDGVEIEIPDHVTKVAVGGALNQMMLILGQPDKIAATAEAVQKSFFAAVYPEIKDIAAGYTGSGKGELNLETILEVDPDVLFGSVSDDIKEVFDEAGIITVGISMANPEEIKETLTIIAKVIGDGAEEKAKEFCDYYDSNIQYVEDGTQDAKKVTVFVAGSDGSDGAISTVGLDDIHTCYILSAGGTNITAGDDVDQSASSIQVDFEFLMSKQPEVIVVTAATAYEYIMDKSNDSQWQDLDAVKAGKVYLVPSGVYLWSVRSCEGALQPLWLAQVLHPDLFEDLDMRETTREFYQNFYNYELTDEEIENIFNQMS